MQRRYYIYKQTLRLKEWLNGDKFLASWSEFEYLGWSEGIESVCDWYKRECKYFPPLSSKQYKKRLWTGNDWHDMLSEEVVVRREQYNYLFGEWWRVKENRIVIDYRYVILREDGSAVNIYKIY